MAIKCFEKLGDEQCAGIAQKSLKRSHLLSWWSLITINHGMTSSTNTQLYFKIMTMHILSKIAAWHVGGHLSFRPF